jgi:PKD repeat protein
MRFVTVSGLAIVFLSALACLLSCQETQDSAQQQDSQHPDLRTMLEGDYTEGRLLVRFKNRPADEVLPFTASEKFEEWGVKMKHAYHGELTGLYLIEGDFRVRDLLPIIISDPDVKYAEPDYKVELFYQPNDPGAQSGTSQGDHLDKISAFDAWNVTKGDSSFVIALIDTGCTVTHEDLADNLWINTAEASGVPGVDDDGNGYIDDIHGWNLRDENNNLSDYASHSHGTATSSAAAGAGDNNKGIAGIAFQCKFAMLKGFSNFSMIIEGFQYATDKGFKVINASWGSHSFSSALSDGVTELDNNGILLVCAVSNNSYDLNSHPCYPACLTHDNVISVMGSNQSDEIAWFSDYGAPHADLAVPSEEVYLAKREGGYDDYDGTSFGAPLVTGACALLWSRYPSKTHTEIKQQLLDNVDVLSSLSGLCVTEGRLNIRKALDAGGSPPPPPPVPEAGFTGNPTSGDTPLTVSFTDLTSGQVSSWHWDFGDISVSDQQNPSHEYFGAGTYTVSLTVTGPGGSDTKTKTNYITVTDSGVLNANFSAVPFGGVAPLTVQFADTSSGSPTSWEWDFGDGETSIERNPEHTYDSTGSYTVSLTVSNTTDSDTEIKNNFITVTDTPLPVPVKKEKGGCACAISSSPTPANDLFGYFMPVILLAGVYLALRRQKGKAIYKDYLQEQLKS